MLGIDIDHSELSSRATLLLYDSDGTESIQVQIYRTVPRDSSERVTLISVASSFPARGKRNESK